MATVVTPEACDDDRVRGLVHRKAPHAPRGIQIEPECAEAVRAVIPDGSAQQAEVGFPLAANLLDIYRYRYQSIEAFRLSRHGWPGFFLALESAAGRVGLLTIRCSDWRFIVLTDENLNAALACLYRPPSP